MGICLFARTDLRKRQQSRPVVEHVAKDLSMSQRTRARCHEPHQDLDACSTDWGTFKLWIICIHDTQPPHVGTPVRANNAVGSVTHHNMWETRDTHNQARDKKSFRGLSSTSRRESVRGESDKPTSGGIICLPCLLPPIRTSRLRSRPSHANAEEPRSDWPSS